jgi:hypothetical protein
MTIARHGGLVTSGIDEHHRRFIQHESGAYAKKIADSIGPDGVRLTSFELRFHRFILAEVNTHCVLARNSASSRAIPVAKQLERYTMEPAMPYAWPCEQPGMQGGSALEGWDLELAQGLFANVNLHTVDDIEFYFLALKAKYGDDEWKQHCLHKSVLNRLLEPMQWHTALITGSHWENVWDQRVSPLAQPEFDLVAWMANLLLTYDEPEELKPGEWHLPYVDGITKGEVSTEIEPISPLWWENLCLISTARCARTSLMTQDGKRDWHDDASFPSTRLQPRDGPPHMSPFEHPCTPAPWNTRKSVVMVLAPPVGSDARKELYRQEFTIVRNHGHEWIDVGDAIDLPRIGKFRTWLQFRHLVEAHQGHVSYR